MARGEQNEDSDVDVLMKAEKMDVFTLIGIRQELAELMDKPVDVVMESKFMPSRFKARIEKEVIYV